MKRIICLLLALIFAFSLPVGVYAADYPVYNEEGEVIDSVVTPDVAPENCKAVTVSQSWVKISWNLDYYSYDYDGFEILRYIPKNQKLVHIAYTSKYEYKVKELKPATTYYFVIRTYVNYEGAYYYGAESKPFSVSTAPSAAKLKKVSYQGEGKLKLKFKKSKKASGYIVQYSTNRKFKPGFTNTVFIGKKKDSYTVKNLGDKTYYVRLCAFREVDGIKYTSAWSSVKSAAVKRGVSLKQMINATKTDLSGRKMIKKLTGKDVDIKKYNTTYERIEALYKWHAVHGLEFSDCLQCNSHFNECLYYLYGENRSYDSFIWIDAGDFQNRDGSLAIHKWSVLYYSGIPFIFDPRLQSYTKDYNGKLYFGLEKGSTMQKRYKHDGWYYYWGNNYTLYDSSSIIKYHK